MMNIPFRSPRYSYVAWGILLWFFVDFGTAGGFRFSYLTQYGIALWFFYIGFPLIFAYLIYGRHWKGWKLFVSTLVSIVLVEGVFTQNPLLLTFPLLLIGIPLSICVYVPLTYFPLWIVNHEMKKYRLTVIFLSTITIIIMILTTFGNR